MGIEGKLPHTQTHIRPERDPRRVQFRDQNMKGLHLFNHFIRQGQYK